MKKILLIFFMSTFLCGCTVNYKIEIKNNKITEEMSLIETDTKLFDKTNDTGWTLRESVEALINNDEFSSKNYKIKSLSNDKQLGIKYSSLNLDSVANSSILNQCYINPIVKIRDGIVTIDTGSNFKCYEYYENLDTIKVTLKINHEVVSTNGENVDNGTYIWNITKDGNKRITLSYAETYVDNSSNILAIIVWIVIAVGLGIGIYFLYNKKFKQINKI